MRNPTTTVTLRSRPTQAEIEAAAPVPGYYNLYAAYDAYGGVLVSQSGGLWYPPSGTALDAAKQGLLGRGRTGEG